jgi:hypothetical protein
MFSHECSSLNMDGLSNPKETSFESDGKLQLYPKKLKKKRTTDSSTLEGLCATVKKDEPVIMSFLYRYKRLNAQIIHKRTIQAILELNSAVPWLQKVPDFGSKPAASPHM